MWILYLMVLQFATPAVKSVASCTFPSSLGSKTWRDSDKGDLVFTTDQMTGWDFEYIGGSATVNVAPTWECLNTTTDGSDIILIMKSDATVQYDSSTSYRPFLCMRLRAVTAVSFYYYLQYAEQTPLDYERITIIQEASVSSVTDPFLTYCLPTTNAQYPSNNEYHMLVLNGGESQAIQDCPPAMYELYTYSIVDTNAGTTVCDTGASRLDMCSDVKRMSFNNTLCSSTAAYSANGSLFCVVVLTSGSYTLHTVYNEDTTVDNTDTYRFTCFVSSVAADGTVSMSVSPRSCTKTQTPTDQPQLSSGTISGVNMNLTPIQSILTCDFPCALPSYLANLNWTDSDKGQLTFTNDSMTGWEFYVDGTLVTPTWKCFFTTTVDGSSFLIVRGSSTIAAYNDIYRPFLCLKLQQITDVSYYYYLLWGEQNRLGYERITIVKDVDESAITDPYNELCVNASLTAAYPTDNEYHLLIKQGSEPGAIQDCPSSFYGLYAYTVEDTNSGTTFCGSNDSQWDVCTDRQRMAINYTHCTTPVAYSGSGNLMCVFSLTSGSNVVHTVYNEDTSVDNTNTFQFTCFVSSLSTDGNLTVSQSPKSCTKTQTPTGQPTLTDGTVVGLNLHLSPFVNGLCPIITPSSDSSTTNIAVIVGSVLGALLLIGLIAAILICFFCNMCCWKRSGKVNTELNNNKVTENDKKMHDKMIHEAETGTREEGGVSYGNENKSGIVDNEEKRDVKAGNMEINKATEDVTAKENANFGDTILDDDPLISPSSIDIASLAHFRSHSRMDTPFGTAPGDTQFQESRIPPLYNSFTLPLLQGKSLTSSNVSQPNSTVVESNNKLNGSLVTVIDDVSSLETNGPRNDAQLHAAPVIPKASVIASNPKEEHTSYSEETNSTLRKENELPDNSMIISSHFQQKNMTYMNSFMELPRKQTVGPQNDHEFREKRNHAQRSVANTKANTIMDIMSKEPGFKTLGAVQSQSVKENTPRIGDANYLLERANTLTSYRNKSGVFQVQAAPDEDRVPSVLDETSEGIAYDDDNQKARKHVHFSPNRNSVRELTFNDFEYGIVEGKIDHPNDLSRTVPMREGTNSSLNNVEADEDMPTSKETEACVEEDGSSNDTFTIDNPRLKTAMSVIYSSNGEDPDKMSLRGYNL